MSAAIVVVPSQASIERTGPRRRSSLARLLQMWSASGAALQISRVH
jgi:hypothetical protein